MKIFIDANVFVANTLPSDPLHQRARFLTEQIKQEKPEFFTSSDILKESLTIISQRGGKSAALMFFSQVQNKKSGINLIFIDEELHQKGLQLFQEITAKDVSAVDCTSFALMQKLDISTAFSFDRHFETAGFTLIKPK